MKRELYPIAISYKNRALLINDRWVKVSKTFELNNVKINESGLYEVVQD